MISGCKEAISVLTMVQQHTRVSRAYLAASYAQLDRMKEASAEAAETLNLDPHTTVSNISKVEYYTETADRDHFEEGMRKAGLPENSTS